MPTLRPTAALAQLLIAGSLLAACTGSTATAVPAASASAVPSVSPTASPVAFACPPAEQTVEVPSNRLVGVGVVPMADYDEVVFSFGPSGQGSGATPTLTVKSATPPFVKAPSGFPLSVAGDSFLRLTFRETIVADDQGTATFQGSTDVKPNGPIVREVVQAEAFEGLADWLVGAVAGSCARVTVDSAGSRVLLDVKAP